MSTSIQLAIVGLIVAAASAYLGRALWKSWFGKSAAGCGSGCGKCAAPAPETKPEGRFSLPQVSPDR